MFENVMIEHVEHCAEDQQPPAARNTFGVLDFVLSEESTRSS